MQSEFGTWGEMAPPDVLPTGYGETPMDRGGPNMGPTTHNDDMGPGWMTAGPGVPSYLGAAGSQPSRTVNGGGGWTYKQFKNGDITVLVAPPAYASYQGRTITSASDPARWQAITNEIGTFQSFSAERAENVIASIAPSIFKATSDITTAAIRAGAPVPPPVRYRPSRYSNRGGGVRLDAGGAVHAGIPTPWLIGGGVAILALLVVGGIALSGGNKKSAEGGK